MPGKVPRKVRILLVDDEPDLLAVLREVLEKEGFSVETAPDGYQALQSIRSHMPDIAVIDLRMPGLDGFSVCRELRKDPLYEHLPVVMLSASGTREMKVEGLNLGVDDFITKPVDTLELLARLRMILKRSRKGLDANPLTHLPGNVSIETRIEEALAAQKPLAVLYLDLNHFKAYNDAYGYGAGDHVIKTTAQMLIHLIQESRDCDFLGHIGGDDFILITTPDRMTSLAHRVIKEFDAMAPSFYTPEDRKRKKIISTDRKGKVVEFPLLSIAIGICHNNHRKLSSYAQISQYGAELKKHAKEQSGSALVVDRRRK
ncbi:MAG: hypothetical protein A3J74_07685 [Elusimicrobia bacterium RIFCSPHIGHO2_02_FULL_57_9]|nr:MAG: hypothetical protein A3J74_07685 [Elusimicrobia bacterium RIFCSPHIGHO2_02_FULL_57_9]